ncbi:Pre-mRNA-splicing factor [Mortierella sp. AD094]|nr:Pre-mRNA-splicing factor [Mortierella sp. AD094]
MSRPARRQIAKEKVLGPQASGPNKGGKPGQIYNVYYGSWSGGGGKRSENSHEKAQYRCDPAKDSGTTKGTYNPNAYFCAFFAKGCCPNGEDCSWLHRIPTRQDQVDAGLDVFGRERFDEHKDDRGGVGSIRSDSKTLYVGQIKPTPDIQTIVEKHFKPWGEIERINILKEKGVAFITYQSRLNAEFAKVAMTNQALDRGEIINIRWATDDPNPGIRAMNKRKAVEMTRQAIESKLSEDFKQAEHLPGSEEARDLESGKRLKQSTVVDTKDTNNETQEPAPTLYVGADGQYYYDYGSYGYNHETQQYDPARLSNYSGYTNGGSSHQASATTVPSLQDRVKASLLSSTPSKTPLALQSISKPVTPSSPSAAALDTKESKAKPAASALGALAAYGSDSESDAD